MPTFPQRLPALIHRAAHIGVKLFLVGWAVRNVIGLIAVVPVFAAMIDAGGTPMAVWIAFCSVAGVALNIIVPTIAYRKLRGVMIGRAEA